jgi:SAM-dependent methyltransferase
MANRAGLQFVADSLRQSDLRALAILEVGSYVGDAGSARETAQAIGVGSYLGVDIQSGPGVDDICEASRLVERYGADAFDVVIATELLEHVHAWRVVVSNLKRVLRPDGILILTTRSIGYPFHAAPFDFWRYQAHDMRAILADFIIESVESDPSSPGVFVRARKPTSFVEAPTAGIALYSVLRGHRTRDVGRRDILRVALSSPRRAVSFFIPWRVKRWIWASLPGPIASSVARHRRPIVPESGPQVSPQSESDA